MIPVSYMPRCHCKQFLYVHFTRGEGVSFLWVCSDSEIIFFYPMVAKSWTYLVSPYVPPFSLYVIVCGVAKVWSIMVPPYGVTYSSVVLMYIAAFLNIVNLLSCDVRLSGVVICRNPVV